MELLPRRRQRLLRRHADRGQPRACDLRRGPLRRGQPVGHRAGLRRARCADGHPQPRGERVVNAEDYFVGPGVDIMRMTVLQPGELLTSIRIPSTWAGAQFYFEKVRDRQVWDFPLVNVASAIKFSNGKIDGARLVVGAVAAKPKRLAQVEAAIAGKPRDEQTADLAGRMAVEGAVTLRYNGYKVPLMRNLVKARHSRRADRRDHLSVEARTSSRPICFQRRRRECTS